MSAGLLNFFIVFELCVALVADEAVPCWLYAFRMESAFATSFRSEEVDGAEGGGGCCCLAPDVVAFGLSGASSLMTGPADGDGTMAAAPDAWFVAIPFGLHFFLLGLWRFFFAWIASTRLFTSAFEFMAKIHARPTLPLRFRQRLHATQQRIYQKWSVGVGNRTQLNNSFTSTWHCSSVRTSFFPTEYPRNERSSLPSVHAHLAQNQWWLHSALTALPFRFEKFWKSPKHRKKLTHEYRARAANWKIVFRCVLVLSQKKNS